MRYAIQILLAAAVLLLAAQARLYGQTGAVIETAPDRITADIARMQPGDELVLLDGVYLGPIALPNRLAGSAGKMTVIRAANRHQAIIIGVRGAGDALQVGSESLYPAGCHWTRAEGLQLAYSKRDGIRGYGSNCVIRDNWVHHNGVALAPPEKTPTGQGISWFGDQRDCLFEGNLVEHNGSNAYDHGFYANGWDHRFLYNMTRFNAGQGFNLYSLSTGFVVHGNVVDRNKTHGIYIRCRNGEDRSCTVTNNVSVDNGGYGLAIIEGDVMPVVRDNILTGNRLGVYATGGASPLKAVASRPEAAQ